MVGIDEVGRGCLAGPLLVVAARPKASLPTGLKDSKLLTKLQREAFYEQISKLCEFGEGWVTATEIDKLGLGSSMRLGVRRALSALNATAEEAIIVDGKVNYAPKKYTNASAQVRADDRIPAVSAAAIYAKVTRDRYMIRLSANHPNYSFKTNVGYGTSKHYAAIKSYGLLKNIHRVSFSLERFATDET